MKSSVAKKKSEQGKLARDVVRVESYARFVITIQGGEVLLIDNKYRVKKLPYMRIIAVTGFENDDASDKRVLLEIGYSRSRPYQQIEESSFPSIAGTGRWCIKERKKTRTLSDEEMSLVYPSIVRCMADIVLETRETWECKESWYIPGQGLVERGVYFTFHLDDALLCRHMLFEDRDYRCARYIHHHAGCVRYWLRRYKQSYYSPKELRSFVGVKKVASLMREHYSDVLYRKALFKSIISKRPHLEGILDAIVLQYELPTCNDDIKLFLGDGDWVLPRMEIVYCRRIFDQPKKHAQDCLVFEIMLSDDFRERHEFPF